MPMFQGKEKITKPSIPGNEKFAEITGKSWYNYPGTLEYGPHLPGETFPKGGGAVNTSDIIQLVIAVFLAISLVVQIANRR